jgi:site-specific recombinase XerD
MKALWQGFQSPLASPITQFLAAKRAVGCRFDNEERMLRLLDRYLIERGVPSIADISAQCLEQFLASRPRTEPRGYNLLLCTVRRLFDWLVDQQELTVSPLQARPRREGARRLPFLYDQATIRRLLQYAEGLPDNARARQRGSTYATIFALLAGLGLRIGEISRLQYRDVDLQRDVLLVRNSKFGKSRLVPFGPRVAARLRAYAALREQRLGPAVPDAPFFSWNGRSPVLPGSIRDTFRQDLLPRLGLHVPAGTRAPCVHGLRHSFAVRTLLRWYREGVDPNARLNHLSTFLGHLNPHSTAVYLTITGELFACANQRFEAFAGSTYSEMHS